jgi:oligopeptide/dipeptide ABC transporter ATP-binding protein
MGDLVCVENLKKYFPVDRTFFGKVLSHVQAVDNVSFAIKEGETLGLVGESGCGKTTVGRLVLRLIEPTSGRITFGDTDLSQLSTKDLREMRREMQIIFQDPYGSLNPRMTVAEIVAEPLIRHKLAKGKASRDQVAELLSFVGLDPNYARRYPHEFSGGQRQRIGIARALATKPKLIICDEPVSALDVSIQSQVLNLLKDLQNEFGLTYLFIAHGLNVVKHVSDRVGVMYLGKMVELSAGEELYANPLHPYTQALLSAIPEPDPVAKRERIILTGDVPSPINPPTGCRFHTRCPKAMEICRQQEPEFKDNGSDHWVACHLVNR